jgi:hypothetical protein
MPLYQINGRNLLFIHVPKTGGNSVEEYLKELSGGQALFYPEIQHILPCNPQHMQAAPLELLFGNEFFDHSFIVVRNPYRRFISEFHWRVTRWNSDQSLESWGNATLDGYERNPYWSDNHLRPQAEFPMKETVVHKLEDGLDKAVHAALRAVGLDVEVPSLPHTHKTKTGKVTASQALVDRLRQTYAADFETFGYDPDDLVDTFDVA